MRGLSSDEVSERKAKGLVNDADVAITRSYTDIVMKNFITPFNIILVILGVALFCLDELISAVAATAIIALNTLISTIQEMRAKRRLDKISLLTRPKVHVVRDGIVVEIDQNEIVKDDLILLSAGDQALVDGVIEECRSLEMDESLLTGESSTVRKKVGDTIYSGSNCVTGEAYYVVSDFGTDSYASKMLLSAKKEISKKTPLEMETGTITKMLMSIAAILALITFIKFILIDHEDLTHISSLFETFVLCLDIVPIALFLLITLTYMIAASRMADTGVLLQRANSVESISHVNTVCMDKTGTITTNRLCYESSIDLTDSDDTDHLISVFASASGSKNRTIEALLEHYGNTDVELIDEIQFSSERKYSAVRVRDGSKEYTLFMGAWTALEEYIVTDKDIVPLIESEAKKGLRTVLICKGGNQPLHIDDEPQLQSMTPISLISIRDEVRPDCRATIQVFLDNGMDLKVISGDDPITVDSLFSLAGIPGERKIVSGPELDRMDNDEFREAALNCNIFGRMKPENKERVIEVLKAEGRYVAMVGDGVNDVKSLKTAQVGISLESGSGAARGVADMVLVEDNFSALPKALVEGRKTVSGMRDILKLYLTRNLTLAMMFIVLYVFLGHVPMAVIQNVFYAFISVSIMAFFMTLFSKPEQNNELILPGVLKYCLPASIMITVSSLLIYGITWWSVDVGYLVIDYEELAAIYNTGDMWADLSGPNEIAARTAMVLFASIAGLFQIFIISPRWKFMSTDGRINKSLVPVVITILILSLIVTMYLFFPIIAVRLCEFTLFPIEVYISLVAAVAVLLGVELLVLKKNVFKGIIDRFEVYYMEKLTEAYSHGDVVEESSIEIPIMEKAKINKKRKK